MAAKNGRDKGRQKDIISDQDLQARLDQATEEASSLRAQLAAMEPTMGPADDEAQVAELRARDERIETLQRQLDSARVREDELTSQTVRDEGLFGDLRTQVATLEQDLALEADRVAELTSQIEAGRVEAAHLHARIETFETDLEHARAEVSAREADLQLVRDEAVRATNERETLERQIGDLTDSVEVTILELSLIHI